MTSQHAFFIISGFIFGLSGSPIESLHAQLDRAPVSRMSWTTTVNFQLVTRLVALFHALRLASRWQVRINQREIPMWVSVAGLIVAAGLCIWAFWLLF